MLRALRHYTLLSVIVALLLFSARQGFAFPVLDSAPIEDIRTASEKCAPEDKPTFSYTIVPTALKAWPTQYVQIRWNITNNKGVRWDKPVFLRRAGHTGAEAINPIWMRSIKASELVEGITTLYIVTDCGVADIDIGMTPKPHIDSAPDYVVRGEPIRVTGTNFGRWDPALFHEVNIVEPGGTHLLQIEEWDETGIVATVDKGVILGRQELFIKSGDTKWRYRISNKVPVMVVKQERFPSLALTTLLEDIFSQFDIHLNNFGSQRSGSRLQKKDAYISLSEDLGSSITYLNIGEYKFIPQSAPSQSVNERDLQRPVIYYFNDINMDNIRVRPQDGGFVLTFYFENISNEIIGINPDNKDIRAFVPIKDRPPALNIDNLRVTVEFDLVADNGAVVVNAKDINTYGDLRAPENNCIYSSFDICAQMKSAFESDLLAQLSEKMDEVLSAPDNRATISRAIDKWLSIYGMGEVTRVRLDGDDILIDYLPR